MAESSQLGPSLGPSFPLVSRSVSSVSPLSLGTIARFVVHNPTSSRMDSPKIQRYALQSEARRLLPDFDVSHCHRVVVPGASGVDVYRSSGRLAAMYGNLHVCGSVWVCPPCASRISERRRTELESAIQAAVAQDVEVYMATYTYSHTRRDRLGDSLGRFLDAMRVMRQRRAYRSLRADSGLLGYVRALEVTYGGSGWHPHCHELLFVRRGRSSGREIASQLRSLWHSGMAARGIGGNEHAFDWQATFGAVADYVSKFGHDAASDVPWSASAEMVKSHLKSARGAGSTAFGLLRLSLHDDDDAGARFREYAQAFKGRHQLQWSPGLRQALGLSVEVESDEDLAKRLDDDAVWLGQLTRDQWRFVLGADLRGELLHVAAGVDWPDVLGWLDAQGCPRALGGGSSKFLADSVSD